MATGSVVVTITVPDLGSSDPDAVGRGVAVTALAEVMQAIGGGREGSGNIFYPPGTGEIIGVWSFEAPSAGVR